MLLRITFLLFNILLISTSAFAFETGVVGNLQELNICPTEAEICITLFSSNETGTFKVIGKSRRRGRVVQKVTTDELGSFEVALAPGRYKVKAVRLEKNSGDKSLFAAERSFRVNRKGVVEFDVLVKPLIK